MTTKSRHLKQIEPDRARLLLSRQLTKVGGDDAAPAFATTTGVITATEDLLKIKTKVYCDDATAVAGEDVTYTVWRFYSELAQDPLGGGAAGGWVKGESKTFDPKYAVGGEKEHTHEVLSAEKLFFQVTGVAATTNLAWLRIDVHVVMSRVDAVPVEANGVASALREVFSFTSSGLVVDTELTLDGATLNIDNLFTFSTDGAATGATWGKLNTGQQLETDLMRMGGELAYLKNLHENETVISTCDDHTDWALQGNGANKADTTSHVLGTGSVEFDKVAGGTSVYLDQTLGTTLDFSKYDAHDMVSFCAYLGSVADISYAFVRLGTDNANYNEWRVPVDKLEADIWNIVSQPIGTTEVTVTGNGWDPSAVDYAAVGFEFGAVGDTLVDIRVDRFLIHTSPHAAMEIGNDVSVGEGVVDSTTQRVLLSSDGPTNTRLGTNGDAASIIGSQAAQLRYIGENIGSLTTIIQGCNDSTEWGAVQDAANLADDTEHVYGTVSVEWDKTGGTNVVSGIDDTITSLDLSTYNPVDHVLACFYIPDLTDVASVSLFLGTDNANYTEWQWADADLVVGWNVVTARLSDYTAVAGTGMQQAAVTYVQVAVTFDAAGDLLNDMKIDHIAMVAAETIDEWTGAQGVAVGAYGAQIMLEAKDFDGAALPNAGTEGQRIRVAGTLSGIPYAFLVGEDGSATPLVADNTQITAANGGTLGLMAMAHATNVQKAATTADYANRLVTNLNGELAIASFDWATQTLRVGEVNPITTHVVDESLVDTTNIAATTYYPSSSGAAMYGYKDLSLTGKLVDADGTLVLTVEATNDEDTAAGDWHDVTRGGYRPDDNTTGNASITVINGTETYAIDFDNLNYRYYRVKVTQTGATNTVIIKARRKGN
mgnify:CR=1 FL=1